MVVVAVTWHVGAIGSLLHFVLGPFLGALSDSIGRRPVILQPGDSVGGDSEI